MPSRQVSPGGCCVSDGKMHRNYLCTEISNASTCLQKCLNDIKCKGWAMLQEEVFQDVALKQCVIFTTSKINIPDCKLDGLLSFLKPTANENVGELNPKASCYPGDPFVSTVPSYTTWSTACYVKGNMKK